MSTIYYVYKATNKKENNKPYIGVTCNFNRRKGDHIRSSFNPKAREYYTPLHSDIRKYGPEAFEWEVIYQHWDWNYCLNIMEPLFIECYKSHISEFGYNLTFGGKFDKEKDIKLIKKDISGKNNPMYGIPPKCKGMFWWTDGKNELMAFSAPNNTYKKGRIPGKHGKYKKTEEHKLHIKQNHWSKKIENTWAGKNYQIINPDGKIFIIKNMAKFCIAHKLNPGSMYGVANGKWEQYRGWKCIKL